MVETRQMFSGGKGGGKIVLIMLLKITLNFRRPEGADVGPRRVATRFRPGKDHQHRNEITEKVVNFFAKR